jgi:hypothetical protein
LPRLAPLLLLLALAACQLLFAAGMRPAGGQLLNVRGHVSVQRAGGPVMNGSLLFQLLPGDLLRVGDGGSAEVILFQNGARFLLFGAGAARVAPGGLKPVSGAAPRAVGRVSAASLVGLNTPSRAISPRFLGVLVRDRGDPTVGPRDPSPNGAVRRAPVTLRWAGPVEGESLRLQISDGERIVHRADLPQAAREYRVDPGLLQPGQYYVWSVTAIRQGESGPRCRALLRLLTADERTKLEQLERETAAARRSSPDNPASLLLMAQAYERLSLFEEARSAYAEVLRMRPGEPAVHAAVKRLDEGRAISERRAP